MVRNNLKHWIRRMTLVSRVGMRADKMYRKVFAKIGFECFKGLLYDKIGLKIPLPTKKTTGNTSKGGKNAKKNEKAA